MDGVVLDDTELIELLALGDKPLLVRHGCCYVIAGGGGGAQICLSLYSNQSAEWSEESDGERKVGGRLAIQCVLCCFTIVRARGVVVLSKFIALYDDEIKAKVCFEGLLLCELLYTLKTPKHPVDPPQRHCLRGA